MILSVTGHRPPKLGGYSIPNRVYNAVTGTLADFFSFYRQQRGMEYVIVGMALGVDQWAAQICINLGIPFTAAIPFHGFESRWPERSQNEFNRILAQAAHVIYVTDTSQYAGGLMQVRNQWMVDNSDQLVAVWNGSQGGTMNCVNYAIRARKPWVRLNLPTDVWEEARRIELLLEQQSQQRRMLQQPFRREQWSAHPEIRPLTIRSLSDGQRRAVLDGIAELSRAAIIRQPDTGNWVQGTPDTNPEETDPPRPTNVGEVPVCQEVIPAEKRFYPARLIDLDDNE